MYEAHQDSSAPEQVPFKATNEICDKHKGAVTIFGSVKQSADVGVG